MIITEFLSNNKFNDYSHWLKLQDYETKCLYFGISANDCVIDSLMAKVFKNPDDHYILVAKESGKWVGTVHIAVTGAQVEFGVIVHEDHRGQGIANTMLDQAIVWARNRGYKELFMHCLTRNTAIRHLCEKNGLQTTNMLGDTEAKVQLAPPDMVTLAKEASCKQRNVFHMWLQDTRTFYQEIYG
jgi:GNAT superfamily N-acetyltransferase